MDCDCGVWRPEIWSRIDSYLERHDKPICIIGDFNAITDSVEKWGGNEQLSTQNRAFRSWVHGAGLIDLGHHSAAYTWTNKQEGSANVSERLDRALANLTWTMADPHASVFHLPRFNSDHSPILMHPKPNATKTRHSFKCENWWLLKDDFKEVCHKAVEGQGMGWSRVAAGFKREVQRWVRKQASPQTLLKKIEGEMLSLNSLPPDGYSKEKEAEVQRQHEKCLLM